MKYFFLIPILFVLFSLFSSTLVAQKKDSLTIETKEDPNSVKKRNYIYFISNRTCEDDKFDIYKMTPSDRFPALVLI